MDIAEYGWLWGRFATGGRGAQIGFFWVLSALLSDELSAGARQKVLIVMVRPGRFGRRR
ncbi:MAG TPA: hypothetical protein VMV92_43105 [Streptosporangiaceae bacterium]|nr:hypothetical protein [Streptosporangiaceae bacterium]